MLSTFPIAATHDPWSDDTVEPVPVVIAAGRWHVRAAMAALAATRLPRCRLIEAEHHDALAVLARTRPPQVALGVIDLALPGLCLRKHLPSVTAGWPGVPWVAYSGLGRPSESRALRVPGLYAVVHEDGQRTLALAAIDAALARVKLVPAASSDDRPADDLTPRQQEILALLNKGFSNKRIAAALGIAEGTAKNHVSHILRTLRATNRTQATAWAAAAAVMPPP